MNQQEPEPRYEWPRDHLVAVLGQPDAEETQISLSEDLPDG